MIIPVLYRFDPSGKGEVSDKEMFNILKIQNKIECKQEQVICQGLKSGNEKNSKPF